MKQELCNQGHSLDDAYVRKNGTRDCRACHKLRDLNRPRRTTVRKGVPKPYAIKPMDTPAERIASLIATIGKTKSKKLQRIYRLGLVMIKARAEGLA